MVSHRQTLPHSFSHLPLAVTEVTFDLATVLNSRTLLTLSDLKLPSKLHQLDIQMVSTNNICIPGRYS